MCEDRLTHAGAVYREPGSHAKVCIDDVFPFDSLNKNDFIAVENRQVDRFSGLRANAAHVRKSYRSHVLPIQSRHADGYVSRPYPVVLRFRVLLNKIHSFHGLQQPETGRL